MSEPQPNESKDRNQQPGAQGQPQYGAYGNQQGQYGPYASDPKPSANEYDPNGSPASAQGQGSGQPGDNRQYAGGQYPNNQYGPSPTGASGNGGDAWRQINPFNLIEEILPAKAKNAIRAIYGVIGVAAIILGVVLLLWPGVTMTVFAVALGIYFLVSGIIRLVSAIVEVGLPGGWRVLDILVGILLAIGGVIMLKNSTLSGLTLTMVITLMVGIGWMMEGVMTLVESWRMPSSGWTVFYAIISLIAGFVVLLNPFASTAVLIIFGGWSLLILGIFAMVRAFRFGKSAKTGNQQ
ncbi:hypothetical protein CRD60_03800 [Bifidobacterium aemilianum]|uniref:HdeD family acid-resistance protein n=1 Tax=Bifidobacterium aemilianum TaxID=2493120 RepID=A0A366K9I8_9BIFI|nr:HdeD family acid-resistance protein [Bifidobacterium aemilianum]RBP98259.1 hypothetical protein CRD60_03800 [Bifidobacterium aemilianum]